MSVKSRLASMPVAPGGLLLLLLLGSSPACVRPRALPSTIDRGDGCVPPDETVPSAPMLDRRRHLLASAIRLEPMMRIVRIADGRFRHRGNAGYREVLDAVSAHLARNAFDPGGELRRIPFGVKKPTWRPVSGRLILVGIEGEGDRILVAFDDEEALERAAPLVGSESFEGELELVAARAPSSAGRRAVYGRGSPALVLREAEGSGVVGLLVDALSPLHRPERHPEALRFGRLPAAPGLRFGFSLPRESARLVERALASGGPRRIRVELAVDREPAVPTTLEATVPGTAEDAPPIVFFAHVDEPGAVDNASGVAALAELAAAMRRLIEDGRISPPRRPMIFLFGQEMESASRWLEERDDVPAAAFVFDMVGADPEVVGAPLLLERLPDPGLSHPLPGDTPSGWSEQAAAVAPVPGHFLADYLFLSMRRAALEDPGLVHRDHPFEGGSDHVPFIERGTPALLLWHFPDDAYHTSRDRIDRVDPQRMRSVAALSGAAALGVAREGAPDLREMRDAVAWGARRRVARIHALLRERPSVRWELVEAYRAHDMEALESIPSVVERRQRSAADQRVDDAYEALRPCARGPGSSRPSSSVSQ